MPTFPRRVRHPKHSGANLEYDGMAFHLILKGLGQRSKLRTQGSCHRTKGSFCRSPGSCRRTQRAKLDRFQVGETDRSSSLLQERGRVGV